ncbi:conserved hypothetical protein [Theileria orientalis strain Shintoku]|uniref:Uncharacterized protein n=1 Tax=Theileria orientalis strain Shintoku TaxID=869250 RepID=J7M8F5_THEOR|nr:conserved hypothetical protein [Theileria orientalis strain Shintoku]BAM38778.1 conserved hypothetical protein [Theileria orientalis strain Shintoku]|eukprot:XP_009689079.1 conserved hypothetical protein [Theileria orientalis strain Shintoku]
MNRANSFVLLYYIIFLLFWNGIKIFQRTVEGTQRTEDVTIYEIGLARTVVCVDHHKKAILQCKPKHVLIVHAAQWSNATCTNKDELERYINGQRITSTYLFFNRTEALQLLCDGLSSCFLKPSKTRHYSLTVSASCINRDLNVRGRKVTDTITSKDSNVDFGCNEDEVIHLSITRVDGYAERGPNRSLTQYNFGPHLFDCNLKQKCQVTSDHLKKCETGDNPLEFGTAVLVYYCRKPMRFSFCDHVKVLIGESKTVDNYVLYAEQDSQVTVKANIFQVLKVESALWSTPDSLTDELVKKDRVDLLKFLCDDRNYCAFTPKRSAAGAVESSFEEVHFGGILRQDKPLVLVARFGTRHVKELTDGSNGVKVKTVALKDKLSIECKTDEGTIHVLSGIAGPTGTTNPTASSNDPDANSVKFKDLTKVMHKICYRKKVCEWNLNPLGGETAGQNTVPAGLENQELTVKFVCKKYTHDPSLVSVRAPSTALLEMGEALGSPTSVVDTEQAQVVYLMENKKLFINLDVYGACTVTVGDFFTIKVPENGGGSVEAYFTKHEATKFTQALTLNSTKYIFYVGMGNDYVDFALDASDGSKDQHHTSKISQGSSFEFPLLLKDVVKATGKIVGMRIMYINCATCLVTLSLGPLPSPSPASPQATRS